MLIFRYVLRETFKAQIAVFLVLLTIFVSQQFVQILTQASDGQLPAQLILAVLGLQLPGLASLILPISLFLGILMAHGRMYTDHEMSVLHACGVSEWYIARVTLVFAVIIAIITSVLTLWLSPWALAQEHALAERARAEAGVSVIQPGRFQQAAQQRAVIFVERQGRDGELEEIFVAQLPARGEYADDQRASVVMSARGRVETMPNGAQLLVLDDGRRYSQSLVNLDHHVMRFDEYQIQIREQEYDEERRRLEAVPTQELLNTPGSEAHAEMQWRIAIPLAMPLLALIAVPLSRVNPRQGKFAKMGPAILIYMGYFMVLMAAKRALADGSLPEGLGLWWIHAGLFIIGISLLIRERPSGYRFRAAIRGLR
ncbi:LPS export ABC transporter permease LptF [Aliidiomarina halalkaliphila]|uniref:Lipopolysaccharide export system permease protein LptF n=1 Tax=Aliidiomarina halalkaliphila TaxID=2593535 RepID=A0A552WYN2_9GAMM|nr:LPS export ABC transporter permease LptF [Aliidiomarina halalkaliphila]TRW47920.1 LPS export ABC transporter permease LptF [Aliidiomarina halalkaliphila]